MTKIVYGFPQTAREAAVGMLDGLFEYDIRRSVVQRGPASSESSRI
jgi:hypothetical protein